jgi:hypothetical protein
MEIINGASAPTAFPAIKQTTEITHAHTAKYLLKGIPASYRAGRVTRITLRR